MNPMSRTPRHGCCACCVSRALPGPLFVMEWLFDEAQLMVFHNNLTGLPFLEVELDYMQSFGEEIRSSLLHVS